MFVEGHYVRGSRYSMCYVVDVARAGSADSDK